MAEQEKSQKRISNKQLLDLIDSAFAELRILRDEINELKTKPLSGEPVDCGRIDRVEAKVKKLSLHAFGNDRI